MVHAELMYEQVAILEQEAIDWVKRLDRSVLGKLAVDERLLVHHYMNHQLNRQHPYGTEPPRWIFDHIFTKQRHTRNVYDDGFSAIAELVFWLDVNDEDRQGITLLEPTLDRFFFLLEVINITRDNIAAVPYVEVGVMDIDVIRHCISNDIDPAIALTLVRSDAP